MTPIYGATLSGLYVYPIKGARGIRLDAAAVTDRGLEHDRRFMVVDAGGDFITQRTHPSLSQVAVHVRGDELAVEAPGAGALAVPLRPRTGEHRRVRVWGDLCDALSLGERPCPHDPPPAMAPPPERPPQSPQNAAKSEWPGSRHVRARARCGCISPGAARRIGSACR